MRSVALLLNTCDKFNDLWPIFLDCLYKFWNPNYKIYLNSETLDYIDERFEIIPIHPKKDMPWSNRLYNCVKSIKEEYVICIEDECLIEEPVDINQIEKAIEMMENDSQIACIHLMHISPGTVKADISHFPFREREYDYRTLICQQVCLWRKEKWLNYIRPNENPWEYECLGSARGVFNDDKFYVVDETAPEVVKYGYGWIVYRGYWCKEEKERLENKLGLEFDNKKRKTETRENIDRITNRDPLFYNRLRIKKAIILLSKKILHKNYSKFNWEK